MKLAIVATLAAGAAAFAPSAPAFTRTSSLGYSVHVFNEDEGIDATFDCADDVFIVGELHSLPTFFIHYLDYFVAYK